MRKNILNQYIEDSNSRDYLWLDSVQQLIRVEVNLSFENVCRSNRAEHRLPCHHDSLVTCVKF